MLTEVLCVALHVVSPSVYEDQNMHPKDFGLFFFKKNYEIFGSSEGNEYLCTRNSDGALSSVG